MKFSIAEQGLGPVVWWNGATLALVEEEDEMELQKKVKCMYFLHIRQSLISFRPLFFHFLVWISV
jgi:hypothetical protein